MPNGPLHGIKILDLTRILSGPFATQTLGYLGAEVIKIEQPGKGDDTRSWGPPFVGSESAYFLSVNSCKKSITLDLKDACDVQTFYTLAQDADIVIENFRPGKAKELKIDYETLCSYNEKLIYASISGFGQTGPLRDKAGYDIIAQAMAGMMGITGEKGGAPVRTGVAIADIGAGMYAVIGILAALYYRDQTGKGQYLETSLFEGQLAWLTYQAGNFFASGLNPEKIGSAHPNVVPYQAFETADGFMVIAIGNDKLFAELCKVLDLSDLRDDARFMTNNVRVQNRDTLVQILTERLKTKSKSYWMQHFDEVGIPNGPINKFSEVFAEPHVKAREMQVELDHPTAGTVHTTGVPIKFSRSPAQIAMAPPTLGQHNEEIK